MDKIRVSELHGEANYSYADASRYVQYLYEQERNRIELNHYISTCVCLSEGAPVDVTLDNIRAINEAISDKISSAWDKILDFLKRMWGKFTESLNSLVANNNEYLEKYKDIILKKPVKFCETLTMNDLAEATKRIISREIPVVTDLILGELPEKTDTEDAATLAAINKVRNRLVPAWNNGGDKKNNPEAKDFQPWLLDYFEGKDLEHQIAAESFNMTDAYTFCRDFTSIRNTLKKDIANVEKSNNEFTAEITKARAEVKKAEEDAAKAKAANKTGADATGSGTGNNNNSSDASVGANKNGNQQQEVNGSYSFTAAGLVNDYLLEFEANGKPKEDSNTNSNTGTTAKSNIASTTNNSATDDDKARAANIGKTNNDEEITKISNKASVYIKMGQQVATAKMNATEFINREYMGIIKAHVAYYVGREGKEQNQATKAGTDFSTENRRAQQQKTTTGNQQTTNPPQGNK